VACGARCDGDGGIRQSAGVEALSVRDAVPADRDAVQRLFRRASLSNDGDRDNLLAHPDALVFSDTAIIEQRTRVATDVDGVVIGFATSADVAGGLELEDLFVDPDRMRRGVARALVLDIVQRARRAGIARIEVTANRHALAFYDAVGFVHDHDVETRFGPAPRMFLEISS
jgi:GNAT superfamily N-acetyltransferase